MEGNMKISYNGNVFEIMKQMSVVDFLKEKDKFIRWDKVVTARHNGNNNRDDWSKIGTG